MNETAYEKKTMAPKSRSHIRKIAATHKGVRHSDEWKQNIAKSARHTDRSGQYIRAEKDGDVRWFSNGHDAAKGLKCSAPMVYLAATGKTRTGEVRGWKVEWVDAKAALAEMRRRLIGMAKDVQDATDALAAERRRAEAEDAERRLRQLELLAEFRAARRGL